ncbi:MAG: hypothetical protein A3H98_08355 [Bacteroidetes bacterium RIFCSPLOWO2_02_FULL_36_8]|nr:MAG: hypothetical protein A3H98_08355 [Bacteroidetes bacterium RIFCSPLOWO2_02_FULL_36_8]OFY68854.1 MAG: hypothetical protein A3G23_03450 [Bacteroidetes bacterium RIFCSPLOWO2_12_FULL_37_12]
MIDKKKEVGRYQRKQVIFHEDNIVRGAYFIFTGKVKIYNTGKGGKEQIVRLVSSGELFGLRSDTETNYLVSSIALDDCVLCFIEKSLLDNMLKENNDFAVQLLNFYIREMSFLELRLKHLVQLSSAEKVAEALLMMKKKYGVLSPKGILLDVRISRQDIADIAGTTGTEAIRVLAKFRQEKIIEDKGDKIVLLKHEKLLELLLMHCCEKDNQYVNLSKCYTHVLG